MRFRPDHGGTVPQSDRFPTTNTLLGALSDDDLGRLAPHLTRMTFDRGMSMIAPGQPIDHVFFPEDGVASIVAAMAGGT